MSVKTRAVGVVIDADELAAEALASQLRDETRESIAVAKCRHGDYIVMPYAEWQAVRDSAEAQGSTLYKVAWAS